VNTGSRRPTRNRPLSALVGSSGCSRDWRGATSKRFSRAPAFGNVPRARVELWARTRDCPGMRLVALVLVVLAGSALAASAAVREGRVMTLRTRPCGTLSVGIGWHLQATPNVPCSSARHLMLTYFSRRANRRARAVISGYGCTRRDLRDGEHISCLRGTMLVTARSFGY
jgi:hypothetical protein